MLIWTARISKRNLAAIALALPLAILILLLLLHHSAAPATPVLKTPEDGAAYLSSMGWEVNPEPLETLQFLLPEPLEEPYLTYNNLQKEQGFDLNRFCGKQVTRYTFSVTNYPGRSKDIQANLYVAEGEPIAGDILAIGEDGFQHGLQRPET